LIAPNQDKLFNQILSIIDEQSTVIDVGCGTGRFAFAIANKCKSILGVDLSKRNIDRAKLTLHRRPDNKISFKHCNVNELNHSGKSHFDYAILTYVFHEVDEKDRLGLLRDIALIVDTIIVADYIVPKQTGMAAT